MITLRFKVYPNECDCNGHFNTQFYVQKFDAASWELIAALGASSSAGGPPERLGWADIYTTIEYHHELLAGDEVLVDSGITRFGKTSMRMGHRMVRVPDNRHLASYTTVAVRLDLLSRRPVEIPADLIARASQKELLVSSCGPADLRQPREPS